MEYVTIWVVFNIGSELTDSCKRISGIISIDDDIKQRCRRWQADDTVLSRSAEIQTADNYENLGNKIQINAD